MALMSHKCKLSIGCFPGATRSRLCKEIFLACCQRPDLSFCVKIQAASRIRHHTRLIFHENPCLSLGLAWGLAVAGLSESGRVSSRDVHAPGVLSLQTQAVLCPRDFFLAGGVYSA